MMDRIVMALVGVILIGSVAFAADNSVNASDTLLKTLRPQHPRLILTGDTIPAIRKASAADPTAKTYLAELTVRGEAVLKESPVDRVLVGSRLLDKSRQALGRITLLGLLYRLDGDRKWADRAILEMRTAAAFKDWNPSHFLDVAEMTAALGFGYDWLYDAMTDNDREVIRTAIVQKGLKEGLDLYKRRFWWTTSPANWNNVCNGGLIVGALAVADEEPELSGQIVSYALKSLPTAIATYAPDGAWPEGVGYWNYATQYTMYAVYSMHSALGTDFGIMKSPGLRTTGYYPVQLTAPSGYIFNFADAGVKAAPRTCHYALARWYQDPAYAYLARVVDSQKDPSPFDLIWHESKGTSQDLEKLPLDSHFTRISIATMRSAWNDPNAVFVGFKAGDNAANHSHLDLGSFVLDADGVRWAEDLGKDDYNLPGYFGKQRFSYYKLSTPGHNTITINGKNQDPKAKASITAFVSGNDYAFAIADLTPAYKQLGITGLRRGVKLLNGRSNVLVRDEIHASRPVDIEWRMHTSAAVTIAKDGRSARLALRRKTLTASLIEPASAAFSVKDIKLDPPQKPLENKRVLTVTLPAGQKDAAITVFFVPGSTGVPAPKSEPLDSWR